MLFARLTSLLALGLMLGCGSPTGDCAGVPQPGIVLEVLDAQTGASLRQVATVTVRRLTQPVEELTGAINGTGDVYPLNLAHGRAGTYEVIASAPSYASASAQVTVHEEGRYCGSVRTEQLVLRLSKQP